MPDIATDEEFYALGVQPLAPDSEFESLGVKVVSPPIQRANPVSTALRLAVPQDIQPPEIPDQSVNVADQLLHNPATRALGGGLDIFSKQLRGATQDAIQAVPRIVYPEAFEGRSPLENLQAASLLKETPRTQELAAEGPRWRNLPENVATAVPEMLARATIGAAGGPPGLALAFGLNKEGIDPVQAAIGAAFPAVGSLGEKLAAAALGDKVASEAALEALKTGGSYLATQALLEASNAPYYLSDAPKAEKIQRLAESIATNLGFTGPKMLGVVREFASQALENKQWNKIIERSGNMVGDVARATPQTEEAQPSNRLYRTPSQSFSRLNRQPLTPAPNADQIQSNVAQAGVGQPGSVQTVPEGQPGVVPVAPGTIDTVQAGVATPAVPQVRATPIPSETPQIGELIGRPVAYLGTTGVLGVDSDGVVLVTPRTGPPIEVANVSKDLTRRSGEVGITEPPQFPFPKSLAVPETQPRGFTHNADDSITIGNAVFTEPQFNKDGAGNVVSLSVVGSNGKRVTIRQPELALDIALSVANRASERRISDTSHIPSIEAAVAARPEPNWYQGMNPLVAAVSDILDIGESRLKSGGTGAVKATPEWQKQARGILTPQSLRLAKENLNFLIDRINKASMPDAAKTQLTEPLFKIWDRIENYERGTVQTPSVAVAPTLTRPAEAGATGRARTSEPVTRPAATTAEILGQQASVPQVSRETPKPVEAPPLRGNAQPEAVLGRTSREGFFRGRPPDIIDAIESLVGKILGRKSARAGHEGYYNDTQKEVEANPTLKGVFSSNGTAPDDALGMLKSSGAVPQDWAVDDIWPAMQSALEARKSWYRQNASEKRKLDVMLKQTEDFAKASKKHSKSPEKADELFPEVLTIGTKFKLGGHEFTVRDIYHDEGKVSQVVATDGGKFGEQELRAGVPVYVDKGSIRFAKAEPVIAEKPALVMEKPESVEEQKARLAAEAEVAAKKAEREKIAELQAKPLVGTVGDIGQKDFFAPPDLFSMSQAPAGWEATGGNGTANRSYGGREAYFDYRTGKGYVDPRLPPKRRAELAWHEIAVHGGIESVARQPGEAGAPMRKAIEAAAPFLLREADAIAQAGGFENAQALIDRYGFDPATSEGRQAYVAELMARKAEELADKPKPSWWRDLLGRIQVWFAKKFGVRLSENGVEALVRSGLRDMQGQELEVRAIPTADGMDISFSVRLARNRREFETQLERGEVGARETAQGAYADPSRIVEDATRELSPFAQRRVGTPFLRDMAEASGGTTYADAIHAAGDNVGMRSDIAKGAVRVIEMQTERQLRTLEDLESQEKLVTSQTFQNRVERLANAQVKAEALAAARDTFRRQMAVSIGRISRELESRTDLGAREEQLREDLKRVKKMAGYSEAVAHSVDDIVLMLSTTSEGRTALESGNGRTIAEAYKVELERSGYDKPKRGEDAESLAGLASEVLASNRDMRQQLTALQDAQRDPKLRADVEGFARQIRNALKNDPEKAADLLLDRAGKHTERAQAARLAWTALNRSVARDLRRFADLSDAARAFQRIEASPEWKAFHEQVSKDTGYIATPTSVLRSETPKTSVAFEAQTNPTLVTPQGEAVTIPLGVTAEEAARSYEAIGNYLGQIDTWISENPDSVHRAYWERQRERAAALYYTSVTLQPTSIRPLFLKNSWFIPDYFFDQVQLPASKVTRSTFENFGQATNFASGWYQRHGEAMLRRIIQASISHRFNPAAGNDPWQQNVLNWMAWASRNGERIRPGMVLDNGIKVTEADAEAFRYMGQAVNDLFTGVRNLGREALMDDRRMQTEYANRVLGLRMPLELGAEAGTTLPMNFSERGKQLARSAVVADDAGFQDLLNSEHVWPFVQSFLAQRKAAYLPELSPLEPLYKELAEKIRNNTDDAPHSFADVSEFLESNTQGATAQMVGEMRDLLTRFHKEFLEPREPGAAKVESPNVENSFTRGFESEVMPSYFYDFGAVNGSGIRNIAVDSTGWHVERMLYSMQALRNSIGEALEPLRRGSPEQRKATVKANQKAYRAGTDFRDFQRLEDQLSELDKYLALARTWKGETTVESQILQQNDLRRLIGDRVEAAVGGFTTLGHITYGSTLKQGMVFSAMDNGMVTSTGKALVSLAMSAFKIAPRAIATDLTRIVANSPSAASALWTTGGGLRSRLAEAVRRGLEGVASDTMSFSKYLRDQSRLNMVVDQTPSDRLFNLISQPETRGRGYSPDEPAFSGTFTAKKLAKRAYYGLLSTGVEVPIELFKTWFPQLGYSIIYDAAARQAGWEVRMLEQAARRAFDTYEKTGELRRFDLDEPASPKNHLTAEILPKSLFPKTQVSLNLAREWFRAIDLPFNEAVLSYWRRLRDTPEAQRNKVRMLWGSEPDVARAEDIRQRRELALAAVALRDVHHAGPTNRSWFLRQYPGIQMISPFVGWGSQSVRQLPSLLGIAPHDARFAQSVATAYWLAGIAGTLGVMALHGDVMNWIRSKISELFYNQKSDFRHVWEGRDATEKAKLAVSSVVAHIALADSFVNNVLGLHQGRGGNQWQPMAMSEAGSVIDLLKGIANSGNMTQGLETFIAQTFPLSKVVINRLPSVAGTREEKNAEATIRKYAPPELQREPGSEKAVITPLTPIRERLRNDVFSGNLEGVRRDRDDYISAQVKMGKTPEQAALAFEQSFEQLSPVRRVVGGNLTAEQRRDVFDQMTDTERTQVQGIESKWQSAAQALGFPGTLERAQRQTATGGSPAQRNAPSGYGSASVGYSGRVSRSRIPTLATSRRSGVQSPRSYLPRTRSPHLRSTRTQYRTARRAYGPRRVRV